MLSDAFARDAIIQPDARQPDGWRPEVGEDCALGGAENAFSFAGGDIPMGTRQRESSSDGWVASAETIAFCGDWIGQCQRVFLSAPGASFIFQSPDGTSLMPGEYSDTTGPGRARATAYIGGCGIRSGVLTIHEVSIVDGDSADCASATSKIVASLNRWLDVSGTPRRSERLPQVERNG